MCFVYVLRSLKDGQRYIGACRDLDARFKRHQAGRVTVTRNRRPLKVVHSEEFPSWSEARRREDFLKTGAGREWLSEKGL